MKAELLEPLLREVLLGVTNLVGVVMVEFDSESGLVDEFGVLNADSDFLGPVNFEVLLLAAAAVASDDDDEEVEVEGVDKFDSVDFLGPPGTGRDDLKGVLGLELILDWS